MSNNTSNFIRQFISEKVKTHETEKTNFNEQLLILDNSKKPYQDALYKVDSNYFSTIQEVNDKIFDVKNAYIDRIDNGCRTNLFWRLVGISTAEDILTGSIIDLETYKCEKISPIGFGTDLLTHLTPSGLQSTPDNLIGLELYNLYGIRIYEEPSSTDIINSYVGSFIGTISLGSNILTVMAPKLTTEVSKSLKVGQIIVDDDSGVFTTGLLNEIVGLGVTTVSLESIDSDFPSTPILVDKITLKYPAIRDVSAPEPEGNFVSFTVLKDPDKIKDFGIEYGSSPYTPQTIKMMKNSTVGTGTTIELDYASGHPDAPQSWNQFMEGLVDPAYIAEGIREKVKKPKVGRGQAVYQIGFTYKPRLNGVDAQLGDIGVNNSLYNPNVCTVSSLPSCPGKDQAVQDAISIRNAAENDLEDLKSGIRKKIKLSNTIREELNEIDLRIWAYRCHLGKANENIDRYQKRLKELDSNEFSNLMDS